MLLQKWQTNRIFEAIQSGGVSPQEFEFETAGGRGFLDPAYFGNLCTPLTYSYSTEFKARSLTTCLSQENLMSKAETAS